MMRLARNAGAQCAGRAATKQLIVSGTGRRSLEPSRSSELSGETAGWRGRPNPVSALEISAGGAESQCHGQAIFVKSVPRALTGAAKRFYADVTAMLIASAEPSARISHKPRQRIYTAGHRLLRRVCPHSKNERCLGSGGEDASSTADQEVGVTKHRSGREKCRLVQ